MVQMMVVPKGMFSTRLLFELHFLSLPFARDFSVVAQVLAAEEGQNQEKTSDSRLNCS